MAAETATLDEAMSRQQRLLDHAKYFDRIMTFLPQNVTSKSPKNPNHAPLMANTDYMHNKKGIPTPKLERALKKQEEQNSKKRKQRDEEEEKGELEDDEEDGADDEESDNEGSESDSDSKSEGDAKGDSDPMALDSDTTVLKQRLRERLEELKQKRKANDDPLALAQGEAAKGDAKGPAKKKRRLEDKKKEQKQKLKDKDLAKKLHSQKQSSEKSSPSTTPKKSAEVAAPQIEFAQFDFGTEQKPEREGKKGVKPSKKQRLQRALEVAQQRQEQRKELGAGSDSSAAWEGMMARARGEKVLDDVARIKKALRHDERKKKKSAKEWNERLDMQKKAQSSRLKNRERNIQEKKKGKTAGGKGAKKGGGKGGKKGGGKRVGFEGGARKPLSGEREQSHRQPVPK